MDGAPDGLRCGSGRDVSAASCMVPARVLADWPSAMDGTKVFLGFGNGVPVGHMCCGFCTFPQVAHI